MLTKGNNIFDKITIFFSNNLCFERSSYYTIGLATYKKIFVDHFESLKISQQTDSFDIYYQKMANRKDSLQKKRKINACRLKFFLDRNEFEQIAILDQMSKIFDALKKYLSQNPCEKIDISKVSPLLKENEDAIIFFRFYLKSTM